MSDGVYVALSGAIARTEHLDRIAGNLANASTTAFRRQTTAFEEHLAGRRPNPGQAPDARAPAERWVPVERAHVVVAGTREDDRQGALRETGNALDLALEGDGYFTLETGIGRRYTRDGHFARSADGWLVAADGSRVVGHRGPIRLPAGPIDISPDGTIRSDGRTVARLRLADFEPAARLVREGASRYRAVGGANFAPSAARVRQGHLEAANVNPVPEIIQMVEIQRTFEALQNAIRSYREMDERANHSGRPA